MYPINAASPERIAVGAVVQISDGAVQTSGVSISVRGPGGASGAGSGTTAYDNVIVQYTPTQAETNFTSFVVVAYKSGCIPVAVTVVTSASGTPGYAGTDQSKIANPASTVNLSGTTIKTATDVEADTQDMQVRLPAALVSGRIDASVGAMAANVLTATAINADAITAAKVAADVGTEIGTAVWAAATRQLTGTQTFDLTGNITGSLSGSVGSVAAGGITASSIAADAIGASELAADAVTEIAGAVWDTTLASHLGAGSTGAALNAAGAAGDPWSTAIPGAYGAGSAGYILGNNIDAAITSRMASYTQPTGFLAATFPATVASTTNIVSGTITTVGTVNGLGTGVITAASIAADAITAAKVAADVTTEIQSGLATAAAIAALPTATQNADALLNRDMAAVSDTNARSPLNAFRWLRNRWSHAAGTLTVYKEDDATTAWTAGTTTAAGDPVDSVDPA
jgi:hypothetical protein